MFGTSRMTFQTVAASCGLRSSAKCWVLHVQPGYVSGVDRSELVGRVSNFGVARAPITSMRQLHVYAAGAGGGTG